MKLFKRIVQITLAAAVAGLLTFSALFALGVLPVKQAYADLTASMTPVISPTDLVLVGPGTYKVGEIIAFHKQNFVVIHRLIAINSDGSFVTKGDANETEDPTSTPKKAVIGVVKAHYPQLGYWMMYFRQPLTLGGIVFLAVFFFIMWPYFFGKRPSEEESPPVQVA